LMFGRTYGSLASTPKKKNKDKGQKEGRRRAVYIYIQLVIRERERLTKGNAITSKGKEWGKRKRSAPSARVCAPLVVAVLFKRLNFVFIFLSVFSLSLSLFSYIFYYTH
jgi:hypothetical protein